MRRPIAATKTVTSKKKDKHLINGPTSKLVDSINSSSSSKLTHSHVVSGTSNTASYVSENRNSARNIQHQLNGWRARLFSAVIMTMIGMVTVMTNTVVLYNRMSTNFDSDYSPLSFLRKHQSNKLYHINAATQQLQKLPVQQEQLPNLAHLNENVTANHTNIYCQQAAVASDPTSKDDDDVYEKGPPLDLAGLRQFSNRETHHRNSKCPRNILKTKLGITLVSQTTLDRLPFLRETCRRWSSPMVVVLCLSLQDMNQKWKEVHEIYSKLCPHVKIVPYTVSDMEIDYKYPINRLRNRGLDEVETSHVLMIDIDFIPSNDLDKAVLKAVEIVIEQDEFLVKSVAKNMSQTQQSIWNSIKDMILREGHSSKKSPFQYQHHALVIPAFERKTKPPICQNLTLEECLQYTSQDIEFMPRSMESLSKCINTPSILTSYGHGSAMDNTSHVDRSKISNNRTTSSKCIVFHSDYFPKGHRDTQSKQWLKERKTDSVRLIPCININAYEPYLVLPWCPYEKLNHDTLQPKVIERTLLSSNTVSDSKQIPTKDSWVPLSPYYDERFYGYGKNKMQHIFYLQQTGYAFSVLPATGFLTHHPHPDSDTKIHWKERSQRWIENQENVMVKMKRAYYKFKCEIEETYQRLIRVLPTESCPDKK